MSKTYETLSPTLQRFIREQKMFFVATAPRADVGHVNVSPKGYDSLAILDERTLAYLDLTGSGAETIAHVRENGRICLMWCAFEGPPKIVRVHGRAQVFTPSSPDFAGLRLNFAGGTAGVRSIILVEAERISDSCGYSVPLYDFVGEREQLRDWYARKGEDGARAMRRDQNQRGIDGLPALDPET